MQINSTRQQNTRSYDRDNNQTFGGRNHHI